jgi:hypothetical protein
MRIDSSGNVGIGTTPNAWLSTFRALQLGQGSSLWGAATGNNAGFDSNVYVNTSGGSVYIGSTSATRYQQSSGQHRWFIAPSGTAGARNLVYSSHDARLQWQLACWYYCFNII